MLGLLYKDLCLLKNQRKFFGLIIMLMIFFTFMNFEMTFLMGYVTFLSTMTILSTISYDDFNHGLSFMFTLPITRKQYVISKYVLTFMMGIISLIAALIIIFVLSIIKGMSIEGLLESVIVCVVFMGIYSAFMIPVQLIYGSEKGRIVMVVSVLVAAGIGFVGVKLLEMLNISLINILSFIENIGMIEMTIGISVCVIVLLCCSYRICIYKISKNEY